jgi:hypothetical protein
MTTAKARQLLLKTAKNYAAILEAYAQGMATDTDLALTERCLEQAAIVFSNVLSPAERSAVCKPVA